VRDQKKKNQCKCETRTLFFLGRERERERERERKWPYFEGEKGHMSPYLGKIWLIPLVDDLPIHKIEKNIF
jgi:hypothetical protein